MNINRLDHLVLTCHSLSRNLPVRSTLFLAFKSNVLTSPHPSIAPKVFTTFLEHSGQ